MLRRLTPALAAVALVAGACGSSEDTGEDLPPATPPPTIGGVGSLPDTVPAERSPIVRVPRPVNEDGSVAELPGEQVDGNRVLVIGDSIMASTAQRYGGQMCDELVPLGWAVQVEAEPSRFVEFGNRVLDEVFDPLAVLAGEAEDWDAAVVFLGSNYRGDQEAYETELREILDTLAPRPTLLFTVTEYRPTWAEVNDVVWALDEEYDNVTVVDWEEISKAPGLISGDRQHPTEAGRVALAQVTAAALGPAALGEGECLPSSFTDDSAIGRGGSGSLGSSSSGSTSGGSGGSSSGGSSGSSSTGGSSTTGGSGSTSGGSTGGTAVPPSAGTDGGVDSGSTTGGDSTGGTTGVGDTTGGTDGGSTGDATGGSTGGATTGGATTGGSTGGGSTGSTTDGGGSTGSSGSTGGSTGSGSTTGGSTGGGSTGGSTGGASTTGGGGTDGGASTGSSGTSGGGTEGSDSTG